RLARSGVHRAAVDHWRHRQPDNERDRERQQKPRNREHEIPRPARAEALQDEPLDQAVEDGPEREHPEDAPDRGAPPLAGGDGHPEAADDRHPRDPHAEPVEEARLAGDVPEDDAVTAGEPRPWNAATRGRAAHGARRGGGVPVGPAPVTPPSGIEAAVTRRTEARAIGACARSDLRFLGVLMHERACATSARRCGRAHPLDGHASSPPGGPVRTVGAYSSSCRRPSKTWLLTIWRATSG